MFMLICLGIFANENILGAPGLVLPFPSWSYTLGWGGWFFVFVCLFVFK